MSNLNATYSIKPTLDTSLMDAKLKLWQKEFALVDPYKLSKGNRELEQTIASLKKRLEDQFGRIELPWISELKESLADPELKRAIDWVATARMLSRSGTNVAIDSANALTPDINSILSSANANLKAALGHIFPGSFSTILDIAQGVGNNDLENSMSAPRTFKWISQLLSSSDKIQQKKLEEYKEGSTSWQAVMKLNYPQKYQEYMQRLSEHQQQSHEYNRDFLASPDSITSSTNQNYNFSEGLLLPIDLTSSIGQFTTLRDTSKEAFSGLTSDIRTTNTQAWQPFGDGISNASLKFSNELTPAGDYAFAIFDDGLGGLVTGEIDSLDDAWEIDPA